MIKQYLQNLLQPSYFVHAQSDGSQCLAVSGNGGLLARAYQGLRVYLTEAIRRSKAEAEIRNTIEQLQAMTGDQLRDLGITPMDIERVVRYGKKNI